MSSQRKMNIEALAKPLADATERVPPVHKSPFFVIFGGPRSVVAALGGGFASASIVKKLLLAMVACLIGGGVWAADELEMNLQNPPVPARPHTWWHWMNGNISREGITADLISNNLPLCRYIS
jgi:alpha-L-rhamnosidase